MWKTKICFDLFGVVVNFENGLRKQMYSIPLNDIQKQKLQFRFDLVLRFYQFFQFHFEILFFNFIQIHLGDDERSGLCNSKEILWEHLANFFSTFY